MFRPRRLGRRSTAIASLQHSRPAPLFASSKSAPAWLGASFRISQPRPLSQRAERQVQAHPRGRTTSRAGFSMIEAREQSLRRHSRQWRNSMPNMLHLSANQERDSRLPKILRGRQWGRSRCAPSHECPLPGKAQTSGYGAPLPWSKRAALSAGSGYAALDDAERSRRGPRPKRHRAGELR